MDRLILKNIYIMLHSDQCLTMKNKTMKVRSTQLYTVFKSFKLIKFPDKQLLSN